MGTFHGGKVALVVVGSGEELTIALETERIVRAREPRRIDRKPRTTIAFLSMLRVNLTDLDRAGTLRVQAAIEPDDPLWSEVDLELVGPVELQLEVTATPTGQVVARGEMRAPRRHECRRCLIEVERVLHVELALVWAPPDELGDEDEDGEIRKLDPSGNELDLGEAVREELILAAPAWVVCTEDCRGLCPRCGINRNEESCDCSVVEPDPRWDALRQLEDEQGN